MPARYYRVKESNSGVLPLRTSFILRRKARKEFGTQEMTDYQAMGLKDMTPARLPHGAIRNARATRKRPEPPLAIQRSSELNVHILVEGMEYRYGGDVPGPLPQRTQVHKLRIVGIPPIRSHDRKRRV